MTIQYTIMKINTLRIAGFAIILGLFSVKLSAQCTAGFTESTTGLTVQFTNQATGSYNWIGYDYGDGAFDQGVPNPTHVYSQAGIYEACQYIQDTMGFCFDSKCDTLYLGGATCAANFYYFPDGLNCEFYSYSFGIYDSVAWSFGDGTVSSDSMPYHTYSAAGTYTACLYLYSSGSVCDSICQPVLIDTTSCQADFTSSTNVLTASFTNTSSGGYQAQFWDFGDNFGSSQAANPSYTYFAAGTYTVCLSIYDTVSGFCFSDVCYDVTVTTGGGGGTGGCQAAYTYTTNQLEFIGTNTSSGAILTSFWDFGDGSTPSMSGNHTYAAPGVYDVCLTVGNIIPFCYSQECKQVAITEQTCEVDFEWSFNDQNVYSFKNLSSGNFNSVKWQFGDGNSSTFANPSYNYNQVGNYEVCLTTYEDGNKCGYGCKSLDVYPLGANELGASAAFIAYPNPSDGTISLSIPSKFNEQMTKITVLDLSGRSILQQQFVASSSQQLNINAVAGTYFMQINSGDFTQVIPIVIR
jgi:PKD repeat protein